jgi:hypothetical protein
MDAFFRWKLTIKVGMFIHRFSPEISDWFCELTGLNAALRSARLVRRIP